MQPLWLSEMAQVQTERRTQQRHRCLKGGKIVYGDGRFVIDCTIDNCSEIGAHLRVQGSAPLPKMFYLVEPGRAAVHKAEIVRRSPTGLGIKLNGPCEDSPGSAAYLRKFQRY
jgi:hypothetical protein